MKKLSVLLAGMVGIALAAPAAAVNVDAYIKKDKFDDIELSPNGDYYAITVPLEDRTILVVIRRNDGKITAQVAGERNSAIASFDWVSSDRLLVSLAEKIGDLAKPQSLGELFAIDAKTGSGEMLVGQRLQSEGLGIGTKIQAKKVESVWADLVDDLPADDANVIITVAPFNGDPYTRAEQMDVRTGRRMRIALAPIRNASFITDNAGVVRFAHGYGEDNVGRLYHRKDNNSNWELISDESVSHLSESPIGFSADNQTVYLQAEQAEGPDAIVAMDLSTKARKIVLRDDDVDPARIIYRNGTRIPVGAAFMDGKPRTEFFDKQSREATLQRSMEAAFGGDAVTLTSQTSDGRLVLVGVWSDRNPGDYYIYDTVTKKADLLLSKGDWVDPRKMASMSPFTFKARDGLALHGYMTVPQGSTGKNLPMVVMPHGGPFWVQDEWGFQPEVQMLADAGYAVLQLNFRGSNGYGAAFEHAGERQWGLTMQDDLTDATRWAITEGIADAKRICIYGGSYGGYASLMGVAKEPSLYKCAAGIAGVYDLPTMHTDGDMQDQGSTKTYVREWIGERDQLGAVSPSRMADRIKVPVFLAAGREDKRVPIKHSEIMEKALRTAGVPVETLYYNDEGHGFYLEKHRREFYTQLLAFLNRHLGGGVATTAAPAAKTGM